MQKKSGVLLLVLLAFHTAAFAFGPGLNIQFSGNETKVQGYGIMNGANSQGNLPLISKKVVRKDDGINYYQLTQGLFVIEVVNQKNSFIIEPFVSDGLETNAEVYKKNNAELVFNAGYFDPNNKQTISYVVKDGVLVVNPEENTNLTSNEKLQPHLDKIFNRSEFRVLQKGKKIKYDVAKHNDAVEHGWTIKHSIQAGPMLVPSLTACEEYFLSIENGKVTRDAISVTQKVARTALGVKNGNLYIIIATTKCPVTLTQMAKLCKNLGLEKAINFDGGGSTSFDSAKLHVVSDKNAQARKLKSFWIIKKVN